MLCSWSAVRGSELGLGWAGGQGGLSLSRHSLCCYKDPKSGGGTARAQGWVPDAAEAGQVGAFCRPIPGDPGNRHLKKERP